MKVLDIFGGGGSGSHVQRGRDIQYEIDITLEEAYTGIKKKIKVPRHEYCQDCKATGAKNGHHRHEQEDVVEAAQNDETDQQRDSEDPARSCWRIVRIDRWRRRIQSVATDEQPAKDAKEEDRER